MVKVQKPTPKTLTKSDGLESAIKKKKDKTQKPHKESKKSTHAVAEVPVKAKEKKAILIEKTVKEAQIVGPVKKQKKAAREEVAPTAAVPQKKKKESDKASAKETAHKKEHKEKLAKKPLILAPPESPAPAASVTEGKKKNKKAKKAAAVVAPVDVPASKKHKKKKGQAANAEAKPKEAAQKKPKQPKTPLTPAQKKKANKRAFKKQQQKNKGKEKKPKPQQNHTFEPLPFDEDKFSAIVNVANIKKIAKALKQQVEKEVSEKKTAIFSDYRYFLNVANFKIPSAPKRMVKLALKHSLVGKDDDVVIVVPDLQRGAKVDYEPTIQHYEDVFREAGVEGLKIMPFNQLRTECNTFEAVRKFGNTYDYFLCDGRLVGQVAGFCGKVFQKPRTTFHAVRLDHAKNIKSEVEKALRRTAYKQLQKGDLISIPVGNHTYTMQQLAENVDHVISQLKTVYPGGLGNVRSLHLKIDIIGTSSLPLYVSLGQAPAETPYVVGPREQHMLKLKKEANEVLSHFSMTKDGDLKKLNKNQVERKRKYKEAQAELLAENNNTASEKPAAESANAVEVPTKKARKEEKTEKDDRKKEVEEEVDSEEDEEDDEEVGDDDEDEAEDDDEEEEDDEAKVSEDEEEDEADSAEEENDDEEDEDSD